MSGLPIIFSDIVAPAVIVSCPSILLPVAWWIRLKSYMITREWQGCRVQDRRYKIQDTRYTIHDTQSHNYIKSVQFCKLCSNRRTQHSTDRHKQICTSTSGPASRQLSKNAQTIMGVLNQLRVAVDTYRGHGKDRCQRTRAIEACGFGRLTRA